MNILLVGSGGREHAIAFKICQSPLLSNLYIAPGNAGTAELGENIDIGVNDFEKLGSFALEKQIDMLIVGPEDPLVNGIHDYFAERADLKHIPVIGPKKEGAILEGSKDFAKKFMARHQVPTAAYITVTSENKNEGIEFLKNQKAPYVLKADGLAAGKGVIITSDLNEAIALLDDYFSGKFGKAGQKVVIEEHLSGIELSVFVLTDGKDYLILPEAKDYKRIGEGDTGLNTGGMGAISPVPFASDSFMQKVEEKVVKPTIEGLKKDNIDYQGFIFIGLMKQNDEPYVIEYNVRMGDPETEAVFPRIKSDMLKVFEHVANKNLHNIKIEVDEQVAATVILVSGGYPGDYKKGKTITGYNNTPGSMVFHAGTNIKGKHVVTNGGRVLAITSLGKTMKEALAQSYSNVAKVHFDGVYFRKDIGFDL